MCAVESNVRHTKIKSKHFLSLLIILLFMLLLHYPVLKIQGFMPKDDWKPLKLTIKEPLHPQIEKNRENFGCLNMNWEWRLGRFTPVYSIVQAGEAFLFQNSPGLWQIETLLIGLISAFLLYTILIKAGFDPWISLLGCLWFLSRGLDLWSEKQIQEELGLLFLFLSLFFIVLGARKKNSRKWDAAGLVFIFLAGLTKETFVFLIPALIIVKLYLSYSGDPGLSIRHTIKQERSFIIPAALLFLIQAGVVYYVLHHGPYSQGLVGKLSEFSFSTSFSMIIKEAPFLSFFLPALGIIFLFPSIWKHRNIRNTALLVLLFLILWIAPQMYIFKNTGFTLHYFYPAVIGFIVLNCIGLKVLKDQRSGAVRILYGMILVFSFLSVIHVFPRTRNYAEQKAAEANAYNQAKDYIIEKARADSSVLIVFNKPWWGMGITFLVDLSREKFYVPVYRDFAFDDTVDRNRSVKRQISAELLSRYLLPLIPDHAAEIDVIFSTYPGERSVRYLLSFQDRPWFKRKEWTIQVFKEHFKKRYFSLKNLISMDLSSEHAAVFTVLVRKRSS